MRSLRTVLLVNLGLLTAAALLFVGLSAVIAASLDGQAAIWVVAAYGALLNATESDLPRVNQPSRDRRAELDRQWTALKARSDAMLNVDLPALNRKHWAAGVGAIPELGRTPIP